MNNIFCGSSCVKYILNDFGINVEQLNFKMTWITELAIFLKSSGIKNINIFCYKSRLSVLLSHQQIPYCMDKSHPHVFMVS